MQRAKRGAVGVATVGQPLTGQLARLPQRHKRAAERKGQGCAKDESTRLKTCAGNYDLRTAGSGVAHTRPARQPGATSPAITSTCMDLYRSTSRSIVCLNAHGSSSSVVTSWNAMPGCKRQNVRGESRGQRGRLASASRHATADAPWESRGSRECCSRSPATRGKRGRQQAAPPSSRLRAVRQRPPPRRPWHAPRHVQWAPPAAQLACRRSSASPPLPIGCLSENGGGAARRRAASDEGRQGGANDGTARCWARCWAGAQHRRRAGACFDVHAFRAPSYRPVGARVPEATNPCARRAPLFLQQRTARFPRHRRVWWGRDSACGLSKRCQR